MNTNIYQLEVKGMPFGTNAVLKGKMDPDFCDRRGRAGGGIAYCSCWIDLIKLLCCAIISFWCDKPKLLSTHFSSFISIALINVLFSFLKICLIYTISISLIMICLVDCK